MARLSENFVFLLSIILFLLYFSKKKKKMYATWKQIYCVSFIFINHPHFPYPVEDLDVVSNKPIRPGTSLTRRHGGAPLRRL
jgi:hypothetical protein